MNRVLSLAIPTHNRFSILRENLLELLPQLEATGVTVHVADSSTDEVTRDGIGELQRTWPGISYQRSPGGLAYDGNCLRALSMPTTDYVWYLGDALRILPGGLQRVLDALAAAPCDFAAVNMVKRSGVALPSGLHSGAPMLLERLGWHLTLAGATIYAREHLADLETRFSKYLGSNFSHLAIILETLPRCQRGVLLIDEPWLVNNPRKRSSWDARTIETFARDWSEFILSLSDAYPMESKLLGIREHSLRTGILEWRSIGRLRRKGFSDLAKVRHHERWLRMASGVPYPVIAFLNWVPRWMATPLAGVGQLAAWLKARTREGPGHARRPPP